MSIPNLPVDFKDDILNTGVNQKRKYQQTYNSDGSVSFEDVTAYQQKGSNFGAQEVNETNGAVNNIYSERILDLDELELVTEPGFFVDAQAVKEAHDSLNSKIKTKYDGDNKTSITINQDYTVQEDGIISCIASQSSGSWNIYVMNKSFSANRPFSAISGNGDGQYASVWCPCNKGDIVRCYTNHFAAYEAWFIPFA